MTDLDKKLFTSESIYLTKSSKEIILRKKS